MNQVENRLLGIYVVQDGWWETSPPFLASALERTNSCGANCRESMTAATVKYLRPLKHLSFHNQIFKMTFHVGKEHKPEIEKVSLVLSRFDPAALLFQEL